MTEFKEKTAIVLIGFVLIIWVIWFCFIREQDFDDY
jgi:RsiW-degrading membrane proteinase PrsW (M82 family)